VLPLLAFDGILAWYNASVERGEKNDRHHVQLFFVILCRGNAQLAQEMIATLLTAYDFDDANVNRVVFTEAITHPQLADHNWWGVEQLAYSIKKDISEHENYTRGGSEWDHTQVTDWVHKYQESRSSANMYDFRKAHFNASNIKNKMKVDSMNVCPLAILFARLGVTPTASTSTDVQRAPAHFFALPWRFSSQVPSQVRHTQLPGGNATSLQVSRQHSSRIAQRSSSASRTSKVSTSMTPRPM
jgi:hypothetical protein